MPVSRVHFKHHRQEGSSQAPRVGPFPNCGTLLASHTNQHQFLCAGVVRAPGIHGWRFASTARNLFPQNLPSPTQCLFSTDPIQLLSSLPDCLIRLQCKSRIRSSRHTHLQTNPVLLPVTFPLSHNAASQVGSKWSGRPQDGNPNPQRKERAPLRCSPVQWQAPPSS